MIPSHCCGGNTFARKQLALIAAGEILGHKKTPHRNAGYSKVNGHFR